MKEFKLLLPIFFLMIMNCNLIAQDRIIKVGGEMLQVIVSEISDEFVKYKMYNNPDGPIFSNKLSGIHKIILESGDEFQYSLLSEEKRAEEERSETQKTGDEPNDEQHFLSGAGQEKPTNIENKQTGKSKSSSSPPNQLQERRTSLDLAMLSIDLNNIQTDSEIGLVSFMFELFTVNTLTKMGELNSPTAYIKRHGITTNTSIRINTFAFEDQILGDFGIGYGIQYNAFTLYSTINTTVYFWSEVDTGNETVNNSMFFPPNAGYFKFGMHWKPFLKRRLERNGDRNTFGIHVSLNSFEGGSSFLVGLSL